MTVFLFFCLGFVAGFLATTLTLCKGEPVHTTGPGYSPVPPPGTPNPFDEYLKTGSLKLPKGGTGQSPKGDV